MTEAATTDYLELLTHSFAVEQDNRGEGAPKSRLAYLSESVFDFTTYDSEMDELFAGKAVDVCAAINDRTTFEYIEDAERYRWYLLMCNMPFFAGRLDWGTSIRGAWWSHEKHSLTSAGLWVGDKQMIDTVFEREQWAEFIAALVRFARSA